MIATMTPVLLHGRVVWDQAQFPRDECEERLRILQAAMAERGLKCLLVAGAKSEFSDLVYLTQFVPYAAWALAVVPDEGEMTLITGIGGGRELPVSRPRTWVADLRNLRNLEAALHDLLRERQLSGPIGLVSADTLGPGLATTLRQGLTAVAQTCEADDLLTELRGSLRARELSAVRGAAAIVQAGAAAMHGAYTAGASNTDALIVAERRTRQLGALDFRGLVNQDDSGELAPFEGLSDYRSEPLIGYLAASSLGYWAEAGITLGASPPELRSRAEAALDRMVQAAVPGERVGSLAEAAAAALQSNELQDAEEVGLGNGIGLRLHGEPRVVPGNTSRLASHTLLALRVRLRGRGTPGVLVSQLVEVTRSGPNRLLVPS